MPEEPFFTHPGVVLEELLKKEHMTQMELSMRIGISVKHINELVHQKKNMTAGMAVKLANVFDVSAAFLMQLQCRYDEQKEELMNIMKMTEAEKVLAASLPYDLLHEWGYGPKQFLSREERVLYFRQFIGVADLLKVPEYMNALMEVPSHVSCFDLGIWQKMARWEAKRIELCNFTDDIYHSGLEKIKMFSRMSLTEAYLPLRNCLAKMGIALCLLPPLPQLGTVSMIIHLDNQKIFALSEDYVYEDEFWLRLLKLVGESFYQRSQGILVIYDNQYSDKADRFAKKQLIHPSIYRQLLANLCEDALLDVASRENIKIALVVGMLADDGVVLSLQMNEYRSLVDNQL